MGQDKWTETILVLFIYMTRHIAFFHFIFHWRRQKARKQLDDDNVDFFSIPYSILGRTKGPSSSNVASFLILSAEGRLLINLHIYRIGEIMKERDFLCMMQFIMKEREREPSFLDSFSRIIDGLRFLRKVLYYKTGLFMVAGSKVRGPYYQQQQLFVKLTLTLVTTEEEKGWWFYCSKKNRRSMSMVVKTYTFLLLQN